MLSKANQFVEWRANFKTFSKALADRRKTYNGYDNNANRLIPTVNALGLEKFNHFECTLKEPDRDTLVQHELPRSKAGADACAEITAYVDGLNTEFEKMCAEMSTTKDYKQKEAYQRHAYEVDCRR